MPPQKRGGSAPGQGSWGLPRNPERNASFFLTFCFPGLCKVPTEAECCDPVYPEPLHTVAVTSSWNKFVKLFPGHLGIRTPAESRPKVPQALRPQRHSTDLGDMQDAASEAEPRGSEGPLLGLRDRVCWPRLLPKHRHRHCWSRTLRCACLCAVNEQRGKSSSCSGRCCLVGGRAHPLPSLQLPVRELGQLLNCTDLQSSHTSSCSLFTLQPSFLLGQQEKV